MGNLTAAIEQGRQALRLAPDYVEAANNLAWVLATAADPALQDPSEAIRLVEGSALESGDPGMLDTLAAAYASAGRLQEASRLAHQAADRATELGSRAAASEYRKRATLYGTGQPYIQPLPRPISF